MTKLPKIGDRVLVPFGREMVEGTVLDARNFLGGKVMVETPLWSDDPEAPTTFSTYDLERIEPVESGSRRVTAA
jgi:primosomal protein N'